MNYSAAPRAVKGHLDGLNGSYVVGWAWNIGGGPCRITVCDDQEHEIANGIASVERADLVGIVEHGCNIAFRILVPNLSQMRCLRVFADGVELDNSPQQVGGGIFDGHAVVTQDRISGWVTERVEQGNAPLITALDDTGTELFRARGKRDPASRDPGFVPFHFQGELDVASFGRGEFRALLYANGVRFSEATCNLGLTGHLEVLTGQRCAGWLLSPEAPHRALSFDVFRNGKPIARVPCNVPRPDLQSIYPSSVTAGFDYVFPAAEHSHAAERFSFRIPGSYRELFNGPYTLAGLPHVVAAGRRLSRLTFGNALGEMERPVLQAAIADFLDKARKQDRFIFSRVTDAAPPVPCRRVNIIVPVYRDVQTTQVCLNSLIRNRVAEEHWIILVNDASPDAGMESVLRDYLVYPNVMLVQNSSNLGFVKSVNRGLSFCSEGDILLLNSDTRIFPGAVSALRSIAHSSHDIGTVTAISNRATIFSYPHQDLTSTELDDISWDALARIALERNSGMAIDVPTGHGFCLFVRRDVLDRVGHLDEAFGRGYGEENDLCSKAADLGYRNVAAPAVLVEHFEGVSFQAEKAALLRHNLSLLFKRYPEYQPAIESFTKWDDLRAGRWALDAARLELASIAGVDFALIVHHDLGGGTSRAIADIERAVAEDSPATLALTCRSDGWLVLASEQPLMRAVFAPDEVADLLTLLSAAQLRRVVVHQLLGFPDAFIAGLTEWLQGRPSIFYVHDYYAACPRVTMINAAQQFCGAASPDVCARCVALGGPHEASRLGAMTPADHRAMFHRLLRSCSHVVAPSQAAARTLRAIFADIPVRVIPHPQAAQTLPDTTREGSDDEIVVFGALGEHKGSRKLLEIAQLARLTAPRLSFLVIGYTDRDDALRMVGNVRITGTYNVDSLPDAVSRARGRLALFLSGWPETFGYTLSEAVHFGFVPIVPNIGALAERVLVSGFGVIFPFPFSAEDVLATIADVTEGRRPYARDGAGPIAFAPSPLLEQQTRDVHLAR